MVTTVGKLGRSRFFRGKNHPGKNSFVAKNQFFSTSCQKISENYFSN